jgi:ABC-2 type transport system ATP-binding protein
VCATIDIGGLTKAYAKGPAGAAALSDLDLSVQLGEALALLGPNGAGKSTLIKILSTLVRPDSGRVTVGGFDVVGEAAAVRSVIGVALQETCLYPSGRVRQVLVLHARLSGLGRRAAALRAGEIVDLTGLGQVATQRVGRLSGGMRRRLDLGLALVNDPPVLLLDEPTESLDPWSRRELWNEIGRRRDEGCCVLFATQSLEEAERLADRVAILRGGQLWKDDLPPRAVREVWGDDLAAAR